MPFSLSILSLLATVIVAVSSQCDFCPNGIEYPDLIPVLDYLKAIAGLIENGTACSDFPNLDDQDCAISKAVEIACCPSDPGSCVFCPDGLKNPHSMFTGPDNADWPCDTAALLTPRMTEDRCNEFVESGTSTCCPISAGSDWSVPSLVAIVATGCIGYVVAV